MNMRNCLKSNLLRIISSLLFLSVCVVTPLLLLFGDTEGGIIQITDHSKPKDDVSAPDSIFIDSEKTSSLSLSELTTIASKPRENTVSGVSDTTRLSADKITLPGAGKLSQEGYYTTNHVYNGDSFVIAKMTPVTAMPTEFSLRKRFESILEYKQLSDYSRFTAEYTSVEVDRPAVEVYMGYLLVDNGSSVDIYSSTGNYLMTFNDAEYIPAYARDAFGNPLFYKEVQVESGLLSGEGVQLGNKTDKDDKADEDEQTDATKDTEATDTTTDGDATEDTEKNDGPVYEREPHEKDDSALVEGELKNEGEGDPVLETVRQYYTISIGGGYFVPADYDDSTESRGLYFDYPTYYGLSDDSTTKLYVEMFDKYVESLAGEVTLEHKTKWSFKRNGERLTEELFDKAYNFTGGLACVMTEEYYKDGGMYFINTLGNRAFNTVNKYNNTKSDRYIIENYLGPITNGPESIGYFYYDHGLVRARFETIDYWNYKENNRIQVYSSEEVLLNTRGERFDLPYGYEVKGYSNGMILLKKNSRYGFMDYTGKWIAEPSYSYAEAFSEGLAVLKTSDGRFGMIDTKGNIVLPFAYSYLSSSSSGIIIAYSEDSGWEIFRKMTK